MSETIKKRGFASMTPERRQTIARLGGMKTQANGNAHRFTSEEAKQAGKLGLVVRRANKKQKEVAVNDK